MTLKEFAQKYDVPYHVVYEASYKVPAISTMRKDREYPEKELFLEVRRVVTNRISRHRDLARKQAEILDHLRGRCP
jgi:hypothetical protein